MELQIALKGLDIDGDFGSKTKSRTKSYQKSKKITADGVVRKQTAHKLGWLFKNK